MGCSCAAILHFHSYPTTVHSPKYAFQSQSTPVASTYFVARSLFIASINMEKPRLNSPAMEAPLIRTLIMVILAPGGNVSPPSPQTRTEVGKQTTPFFTADNVAQGRVTTWGGRRHLFTPNRKTVFVCVLNIRVAANSSRKRSEESVCLRQRGRPSSAGQLKVVRPSDPLDEDVVAGMSPAKSPGSAETPALVQLPPQLGDGTKSTLNIYLASP